MEDSLPEQDPAPMTFDSFCIDQLRRTRKWTKFISLIGFIFLVCLAIVILLVVTQSFKNQGLGVVIPLLPMALLCAIYYFPIYYLWQFSNFSRVAIAEQDTECLSIALRYLRLHYTFMGILLILAVIVYGFTLIGLVASNVF